MNRFEELKGCCLVMDNASINTSDQINNMVTETECRCVYLLFLSHKLNPTESFWSVVKNKGKRSSSEDGKDLAFRIAKACSDVPPYHLNVLVQHSANPSK
jgi:transposase